MAERVIPFSQLSQEELGGILAGEVNWKVHTIDGREIADWTVVHDSRYGDLVHTAIIDDETGRVFDKVDLQWSPAAFVVIYRRNGQRIEFLLPRERRVLLKDEAGNQGEVTIRNIPQGLIKIWNDESPEHCARREIKEETGIDTQNLTYLGSLYFDAANSQTAMPFFLAEVEPHNASYEQSLHPDEKIAVGEDDWFALEDIPKLRLQCAKTLAGLALATGFLGLWSKESTK